MKEYELVVLYRPELEADMIKPLEKVAKIIKEAGGEIAGEDDWGRKHLAYKINGEGFAIYRVYALNLPPTAPQKINDVLNITDEVMRFLLTKVDPKAKETLAAEKQRGGETDHEIKDEESEE